MSYQVSEIFSPYFKYCAEQTACQQYCKEQDRDNQVFKAYLAVSQVVVRVVVMVMVVMVMVVVLIMVVVVVGVEVGLVVVLAIDAESSVQIII